MGVRVLILGMIVGWKGILWLLILISRLGIYGKIALGTYYLGYQKVDGLELGCEDPTYLHGSKCLCRFHGQTSN